MVYCIAMQNIQGGIVSKASNLQSGKLQQNHFQGQVSTSLAWPSIKMLKLLIVTAYSKSYSMQIQFWKFIHAWELVQLQEISADRLDWYDVGK